MAIDCAYYKNMDILVDGHIVNTINGYSSQHYYPHSLLDYATAITKYIKNEIPHLPIIAVDCHDCYLCDFQCKDCLASETKDWFKNKKGLFADYKSDYAKLKQALRSIVDYSSSLGCNNVRFEMSGEGNPDLYPYRSELIKYAYSIGMEPVYISSGSAVDESLCNTLVKYCHYIRISLPGITNETYRLYSGQSRFQFTDAIDLLKKLVTLRKKYNRENELLIGARCCLRPEYVNEIGSVASFLIDEIGVDSFQIVRAIVNDPTMYNEEVFLIPLEVQESLARLRIKKEIELPNDCRTYYNYRKTVPSYNHMRCFSSEMMPILYGQYLLPCTHTRIIKEIDSVGVDLSEEKIQPFNGVIQNCETCCSINDNIIFNDIYYTVNNIVKSGKSPDFLCY